MTPFTNVYSRFLAKISDFTFVNLTQDELEESIETYLNSAIVKFRRCKSNLSDRDVVLKQFNSILTDEEEEIIAQLMVVEYLSPKIITADLLQQSMSSRDFSLYSQANHIKEIRSLRNEVKKEADKMITDYSYHRNSLDDMK